jgi:hypothetical protein
VDLPLIIPSHNTQYIQEAHIAIGHIIADLAERALVGGWASDDAASDLVDGVGNAPYRARRTSGASRPSMRASSRENN